MEAQDGPWAYYLHTPAPKPVARKADILEEWMEEKAAEKMKKLITMRYVKMADQETVRVAIPTLVSIVKSLEPPDVRVVLSITECKTTQESMFCSSCCPLQVH
jgi:hypothetical protein